MNLADTLRREIEASGQSLGEIARASGISTPMVSRFMRGERGINLDTAQALCDYLGLKLVKPDEPPSEAKPTSPPAPKRKK